MPVLALGTLLVLALLELTFPGPGGPRWISGWITISGLLAVTSLGLWSAWDLPRGFQSLARDIRQLDAGVPGAPVEVTHQSEFRDLGQALNAVAQRRYQQVEQVNQLVQHLAIAAERIQINAELAESNTADEVWAVEESHGAMVALQEAANRISENAQQVRNTAEKSASASLVIGDRIQRLNDQSRNITQLTESIHTIADRSDVLALNAALEGIRAGEAGSGFSLLGTEMSKLAEQIKHSVQEINALIAEIQELSFAAQAATEEGKALAARTSESSRSITHSTEEQLSATVHITQAMDVIHQHTQVSVSGAQQAKETAADLVQKAGDLQELLSHAP